MSVVLDQQILYIDTLIPSYTPHKTGNVVVT